MNDINISRRALLDLLLRGSTAAVASHFWMGQASAVSPSDFELPAPDATDTPSFEVFLALSQLVTLRRQLDVSIARRMYPLFLDEPLGRQHIRSTYAQLSSLATTTNPDGRDPKAMLGKGEAWFASHLLTTWYLGVYYHERMPPHRVAYAEALMFDAVAREMPRRYVDAVGYGAWCHPSSPRRSP